MDSNTKLPPDRFILGEEPINGWKLIGLKHAEYMGYRYGFLSASRIFNIPYAQWVRYDKV